MRIIDFNIKYKQERIQLNRFSYENTEVVIFCIDENPWIFHVIINERR